METNFNPTRKRKTNVEDVLLTFSRLFVGILFIFSGFIKANDPTGFGYKLQEYFHVFHLDSLNDYSTWIAILICGFEMIAGAFLLLGLYKKTVAWGLLLLIIFFTFLTFYSAFFEVVTSCGCFGDAIPLTPWQSFIKDLILFVFILVIFRYRNRIKPLLAKGALRSTMATIVVLLAFGIGIYTYYFLPFIDFLPYKEGNNIPELMVLPEGKQGDVFEYIYEIKNKSTGETKKVTDKEYMAGIWEDENWEVVGEPSSRLVKKGYQIPIPDLLISDADGNDVTQEIVTNPYYNFIVVSTYADKLSTADIIALDRINTTIRDLSTDFNIRAVLLTASSAQVANSLNEEMDLMLEMFYADAVPLKSMVRSNPGVLLLQNGVVIKKWSKITFPSKEELEKQYLAK
ncbi:BT_3928 family protein [Sphingobacterium paludis]|uniref:Putative membrane protein YphA (DoxX/SURF4 family) n=1 Tax=Sphingobacterium paludis TaxID=1476465 RepID=A0A4R7CX96_9SPHI|nr:BT_3928 family protein [Sphingobacterium paludis]TDS12492.1 putative membrane protein YphA (DoxX/SURF4 family) [Sphingobacterium paludis]